jgi:hypothetical protein
MDKQAIFDKVLAAMRAQGQPSAKLVDNPVFGDTTVKCLYRDGQGNKCGIGHLIPDVKYSSVMEGKPVSLLLEDFPWALGFPVDAEGSWQFLDDLQTCHDKAAQVSRKLVTGAEFMARYEGHMEKLAQAQGLTYTPPSA